MFYVIMETSIHFLFGFILFTLLIKDAISKPDCAFPSQYVFSCSLPEGEDGNISLTENNAPRYIQTVAFRRSSLVSKSSWVIVSVNTFQEYVELKTITIRGRLKFAPELITTYKTELLNNLFKLPKLEIFLCEWCELTDEFMFQFPPSIVAISLQRNQYTSYNFTEYYPNLHSLHLSFNKLTRLPVFHHYPKTLKVVNVEDNPIFITVDDLAMYCGIALLKAEIKSGKLGEPASYCHCVKVLEWIVEYNISLNQNNTRDGEFRCSEGNPETCKDYSLEEAHRRRDICLSENDTTYSTPGAISPDVTSGPTDISPSKITFIAVTPTAVLPKQFSHSSTTTEQPLPSFMISWWLKVIIPAGVGLLFFIAVAITIARKVFSQNENADTEEDESESEEEEQFYS